MGTTTTGMRPGGRRRLRAALAGLATAALALAATQDARPLRVATSGDYAPFSVREADGALVGFDPRVARAFAGSRGDAPPRWVALRWPSLLDQLAAGEFDVAMSGVTVRPDRSLAGRFSVPVAESGAVALVRARTPLPEPAELDAPDVTLAVNAGGHLERTVRRLFPHARVLAVAENQRVLDALLEGRAQAAVTDSQEAPAWLARASGLAQVGPLTRDRKAYLLPAGDAELARALDDWLLAREADGQLGAWRDAWLPGPKARTAEPLAALVAALDERLALMPWVAEAKRRSGSPVRVPEQEARVVAAGLAALRASARRLALPALDEEAARDFLQLQIAAAREVQEQTLAAPPAAEPPPDLDAALRPAIARVGERIAELLPRLPSPLAEAEVAAALEAGIRSQPLSATTRGALARALAALANAPRTPAAAAD